MKVKRRKNNPSHRKSRIFLGLIGVLVVLLIVFLLLGVNWDFKIIKEVQSFEIQDGCSLIAGNLLHEIGNDADCKIRCSNLCEVRELNYYNHNFLTENLTCYSCECDCK
jgi:hypothetical protein